MIALRHRRRRLPLTPLIDVIFLLLLFFMLSSTFLRYQAVEVSAARAGERVAGGTKVPAALLKLARDGSVSLNGKPVETDTLAAALEGAAEDGMERLVVTAATGSDVELLVKVLEIVKHGPLDVVLAGRARGGRP